MDSEQNKLFKVASSTNCTVLATGLYSELEKENVDTITMRCIGASSLNQAIKAVANLNSLLAGRGKYALLLPSFTKVKFADSPSEYTAIELKVIVNRL